MRIPRLRMRSIAREAGDIGVLAERRRTRRDRRTRRVGVLAEIEAYSPNGAVAERRLRKGRASVLAGTTLAASRSDRDRVR